MQIQVNTSNGVENKEALERWAEGQLRQNLGRFVDAVTRVEIHLSDENHDARGGADKRCVMEARLVHHQPLAVTQHAASLDEAFRGAADKLKRSLDNAVGRLYDHRRQRESIRTGADGAAADGDAEGNAP